MVAAIIVAAGSSQRMGFDKLTASLQGKPLLLHTLSAFDAVSSVDQIVLVTRPERVAEFESMSKDRPGAKPLLIVEGGLRRQDSVGRGLAAASEAEVVAVHDAARPLIRPETISHLVDLCWEHHAVALAAPVTDTLKRADSENRVAESIDRGSVYAMQTPQVFRRHLLAKAYAEVERRRLEITDEVSAVELLDQNILLVSNSTANPKITFAHDLRLAELILSDRGRSTSDGGHFIPDKRTLPARNFL